MRAPDNRPDAEIIADIIKLVECPAEVLPGVRRFVERLIDDLRTAPESFSGNQKENVEFAEKLHNKIASFEHTLKSAPNPFVLSVLFEERFSPIWWDEQESIMAINANTKRYIAAERARQQHFAEELGRLRAKCERIISGKPGEHGGIKDAKRDAARASFVVLEAVAIHTPEPKLQLGCAPTSKFVEVARLFHEAATGEYDADLVRSCKTLKAKLDAKT